MGCKLVKRENMNSKMNRTGDITLLDIEQAIRTYAEKTDNKGAMKACNDIIEDLDLNANEFLEKYTGILNRLNIWFDEERDRTEETSAELEYWIDYNNQIVDVLKLIDPRFEFAEFVESFLSK